MAQRTDGTVKIVAELDDKEFSKGIEEMIKPLDKFMSGLSV